MYQLQNSYMITSVIQASKIPVSAATLAELLQNGLQACCVPCVPACTVLSTITFRHKLGQSNKKEEQLGEGTGQDRSGCKKAPQGINPYHTISYNLHEEGW